MMKLEHRLSIGKPKAEHEAISRGFFREKSFFSADPVTCMMGIYDKMITGTSTVEIPLKPRV